MLKLSLLIMLSVSAVPVFARTYVVQKKPVQRHGIHQANIPALDGELIRQSSESVTAAVLAQYKGNDKRYLAIKEYGKRQNTIIKKRVSDRETVLTNSRILVKTDPFDERFWSITNGRTDYKKITFVVNPPIPGLVYISNSPTIKRNRGNAKRISGITASLNPDHSVGFSLVLTEPDAFEKNPEVTISASVVYKYSIESAKLKARTGIDSSVAELALQIHQFSELYDYTYPKNISDNQAGQSTVGGCSPILNKVSGDVTIICTRPE